ncbi:LacI family DNA-binding transcriptional regulator [Aquabacterium sp. A7-Y]|uniref:LacI family DNA-binding transcriptional regulator n=1 Tax=Aquabacterium sp. A7-Y TaxID=1349605 RepID=UPI00223D84E0|nr:LacI family DNA-binding transcriptional regulator [Aquabacterium sp. A7-Y]MCW7539972.1 LacI family DNA-binding transcriptional regulator [Aquabacterium sp. A7-Y]
MSGKASVRDVALAAGVSIASVSRVLNNSGYASEALRQRVERAVAATGYAPNFSAKHLRTGRSKAVGFMVSNMANPFLSTVFAEAERRLQVGGFSLLVASTYDQPSKEQELLTLFENRRLEGIIASPCEEGVPRARNPFVKAGLPLVILDREVDCDGDLVFLDHRAGVRQAVEYLASLGHRRIALFGPSLAIRPGREKLLGYRDGLEACGLEHDPALVCMLRSAVDSPHEQMAEMLRLPQRPTALIGLGTRMLAGVLRTVRRAGLEIPRDLSIVGIGTDDVFAFAHPPMTLLRFKLDRVAQVAADLMLDRLSSTAVPAPRTVTVPFDLVLGESCRAVHKS